jgi:hypothetical protein
VTYLEMKFRTLTSELGLVADTWPRAAADVFIHEERGQMGRPLLRNRVMLPLYLRT